MNRLLSTIIKFAISSLIIALLFNRLDIEKIFLIIKNADVAYYMVGFAIIFIALFLMTLKFSQFIKVISNISLKQLFYICWASNFLGLLGLGSLGGEVYKMFSFREKKEALSVSLTDKAYSFLWCLVLLISHYIAYGLIGDLSFMSFSFSLIFFFLVVLIIVLSDRTIKVLLLNFSRNRYLIKIIKLSYIKKMGLLKHSVYTLLYIHITFIIYTLIFYSVGIEPRLELLLFIPAIIIFTTLPISIQGLGVREFVFVQYAIIYEFDVEIIIAGSLMIFIIYLLFRSTGIFPFLLLKNMDN